MKTFLLRLKTTVAVEVDSRKMNASSMLQPVPDCWFLFLDIDGVLNSNHSRAARMERPGCTMLEAGIPSAEHLALLERLVTELPVTCKIVLSSTWRLDPEDRQLVVSALSTVGLELSGDTPDLGLGSNRVQEINQWLENNQPGAAPVWIAVDDMLLTRYDAGGGEAIGEDHFERTFDTVGLSADNVASAVEKVRRQLRRTI